MTKITKEDANKCLEILCNEPGYKAYDKVLSILPNDSPFRKRIIKKKRWLKKFGHCTIKQRRPRKKTDNKHMGMLMVYLHEAKHGRKFEFKKSEI